MKNNIKTIIFDMDGVIFDSERALIDGWVEISHKYGFVADYEVAKACIGVKLQRTKEIYLEHFGPDFPFDEYQQEVRDNYEALYDTPNIPIKLGVVDFVKKLKANGYTLAIASSTVLSAVERQVRAAGIREYFDVVLGGDDVKDGKPAPDIYLMAAEKLGKDPSQVIVIEDSYNGIKAASAAGAKAIMVPDILPPNEEMREKAWKICKDFDEVREVLELK